MVKKKKKIIKTAVGDLDRYSEEVWKPYFQDYLSGNKSQNKISEELGIDVRVIRSIFTEFGWSESGKTHIRTKIGFLSRDNLNDWKPYYDMYFIKGKSYEEVSNYLGLDRGCLRRYFDKFNFPKRNMSESVNLAQDKIKKTNMEKRGVPYPMMDVSVRSKVKNTCIYRYKTDNVMKVWDIKSKVFKTNINKYGCNCVFNNEEISDRINKTNLERYGDSNYKKSIHYKNIILSKYSNIWKNRLSESGYILMEDFRGGKVLNDNQSRLFRRYKIKHLICGTVFESPLQNMPTCPKCFSKSKIQIELANFIEDLGFEVIINNKSYLDNKYEIDIFIPELNVGFEYNGLYWHREDVTGKNYHRDKTNFALSKGIKLYHIWSCDNIDIIKSMIKNVLGIFDYRYKAKDLELRLVRGKDRAEFFNNNHIHENTGCSFSYGLYSKNNLIQCISFKLNKNIIENTRFATKIGSRVDFGFSRLLKHSIIYITNNYSHVDKLITFAYRDWTPDPNNNVYINNNFRFIKDSGTMLYYTDGRKLFNRHNFMKYKLRELFPDVYDENLTEKEILALKGIYSIYNSGNLKFELDLNKT